MIAAPGKANPFSVFPVGLQATTNTLLSYALAER